jgi:hypothetical protein
MQASPSGTGGVPEVTPKEYGKRQMAEAFSCLLYQSIHFQPRKYKHTNKKYNSLMHAKVKKYGTNILQGMKGK